MKVSRAVTVWTDRAFDAGVLAFASWTIAYHVCLVLRLGVAWAWVLTAACLAVWGLLLRLLSDEPGAAAETQAPRREGLPPEGRRAGAAGARALLRREWPAVVAVLAATEAAIAMTADAPWAFVWPAWMVAAIAGTATAWRRLDRDALPAAADPPLERWGPLVAFGWASAMAVVSLCTMGPSPDDMYYVNLSQWVADFGVFPHRDTMYADLTYPMSNWPPAASYDTLVGAVARLLSAKAATVEYLLVVPVASFLAVLVLWRMLRAWRLRAVVLALSVMMLSLLVGVHGHPATAGEGLVVRIWQGKFLLTWLAVPWVVVHLVRYFDRPSRRQLLFLFAGGVAAVGCSTTGIFVVPVMAFAAAVPLVRSSTGRALACLVATAAYPLGTGVVTKLVGGRTADLFETHDLFRFDPEFMARSFFFGGAIVLLVVPVALLGSLMVPHREARVMTGVLAIALGVVFIPGVAHLSYETVGLGPTIRRIEKGLVLLALVGVAVAQLATYLRRWRVPLVACAAAATIFFLYAGAPVRAQMNSRWEAPFHWQVKDADRVVASRIVRDGPFDGLVLAPDNLAIAVTISTTSVKTVATRPYYLEYLRDDPTFHYQQRLQLLGFVENPGHLTTSRRHLLDHALATVPVSVACVNAMATERAAALREAGFAPYFATREYRCLRRPHGSGVPTSPSAARSRPGHAKGSSA